MTRVRRIAVAGAALAALLTLGGGSQAAAPGAAGRIVFAAAWAENLSPEIFRVDVGSGKRVNLSRNAAYDDGAVLSPDGARILFRSGRDNDNFQAIWSMRSDGSDVRRLVAGSSPSWSPDGRRFVFENEQDRTIVTASADGTAPSRIGAGSAPAWSPDGTAIAWIDGGDVVVAAPDGTGARSVLAIGTALGRPVWSPDGTRLLVIAELLLSNGDVFSGVVVQHVAGGPPMLVMPLERGTGGPPVAAWSPDGTRIAVPSNGRIVVVAASGGSTRTLTTPARDAADSRPTWSPDGRMIAFVRTEYGSGAQIEVVPSAGGRARQVTRDEARTYWIDLDTLSWTPDGRSLVYSNAVDGTDSELYTIDSSGSGLRRLTRNDVDDYGASFSPDGRAIVFVRTVRVGREGANDELFLMRPDGTGLRRLTHWSGEDIDPTWSADGSRILFIRRIPGGEDALLSLYTIRPDGTGLHRLDLDDAFYGGPSWSPDARAIALTGESSSGGGVGEGGALLQTAGDGSKARVLVDFADDEDESVALYPRWSPNGDAILFVRAATCKVCDARDLWTVRPGGRDAKQLVSDVVDAAWSPDGRQVVLSGDREGGSLLTIVSADGATIRRIPVPGPVVAPGLSWQPLCTIAGTPRADRLRGGSGSDRICGDAGNDRISGGAASDRIFGGAGNDAIDARDGTFDAVGCGPGLDTVRADGVDLVGVDCERVRRG